MQVICGKVQRSRSPRCFPQALTLRPKEDITWKVIVLLVAARMILQWKKSTVWPRTELAQLPSLKELTITLAIWVRSPSLTLPRWPVGSQWVEIRQCKMSKSKVTIKLKLMKWLSCQLRKDIMLGIRLSLLRVMPSSQIQHRQEETPEFSKTSTLVAPLILDRVIARWHFGQVSASKANSIDSRLKMTI